MWATLTRRRETGDSAVLAAGITMHMPTEDEILHHHKVMFEGVCFEEKRPWASAPVPIFDKDHLLQNSFRATRTAAFASGGGPNALENASTTANTFLTPDHEYDDDEAY